MGDRRVAEIVTQDGSLYLYTHWGGSVLALDAEDAIRFARPRWDDLGYAVRIIVDQLTKADRDSTRGSGLYLQLGAEDEYNDDAPSVIVDLLHQELTVIEDGVVTKKGFDLL